MKINELLINSFQLLTAQKRLHQVEVPIIAVTGGIASGKSTLVELLRSKKCNVIEADSLIKSAYKEKSVLEWIRLNLPHILIGESINFPQLRQEFFSNSKLKAELENLLYAFLPSLFIKALKSFHNPSFVFYEVPLLFEKNLSDKVDLIVTIYIQEDVQIKRLSERDPQTNKKTIDEILKSQLPFSLKEQKSHFIIENTSDKSNLSQECDKLLAHISKLIPQ